MFALCCYEDKCGTGTGSTFGSFNTFKLYEETARINGHENRVDENVSVWEQFRTAKVNWFKLTESVLNVLRPIRDPRAVDLYLKGTKLIDIYRKYAG